MRVQYKLVCVHFKWDVLALQMEAGLYLFPPFSIHVPTGFFAKHKLRIYILKENHTIRLHMFYPVLVSIFSKYGFLIFTIQF